VSPRLPQLLNPRAPALPTASQRQLLGAAVLQGPDARAWWETWRRAGGDIAVVSPSTFGLLPLLYRNLEANRVDDPDMPRLKGVYRHAWVSNQGLARRLGPAIESLEREGIPTVTLGGPAVSGSHYRDAGVRRMDDVGVLVAPVHAERAVTRLRAGGWSPLGRIDPARILRTRHAIPLREPGGAQMDLQWGAFPESISDGDFWSGAVAATVGAAETLVPGPTEQLLHACVSGVRAGPDALMWIADAMVILRTAETEIDWTRLVDGAARRELAFTTGAALAVLRGLWDQPIPDEVVAELGERPSSVRERLLLRLSPRPGSIVGSLQLWDTYRRRATTAQNGYVYRDFLTFVADAKGLPSRRAIAPKLARRAISLAAAAMLPPLPAKQGPRPGS
jgi:hypothetical protein